MELEDVFEEDKPEKKIRRRTNNLYKMIRQQMEFYFSDSNLLRDRYLQQIIQDSPDGYIDLEIFMKFNKIRALTKNPKDIANSMSLSKIAELNEDRTKLRRILPVEQRANIDDCTIYVERLPAEVDHEWLKAVFGKFGTVLYVGLPRFRQNGKLKGFAFIEFDTPEAVKKACQYFGSECEEDVLSQQYIMETGNHSVQEELVPSRQEKKSSKRKRKRERDEEEEQIKRQKTQVSEEEIDNSEKEPSSKIDENQEIPGKQKKKKHRKRDKHKKRTKAEFEVDDSALRVMSKREWKNWKNRYLSLQKKAMAQIKHALFLNNQSIQKLENNITETEKEKKCKSCIEFQPGVIIKIDTVTPVSEVAKFKEKVRKLGDVAYVDVNKEDMIAYVRCPNKESAKRILENNENNSLEPIGKLRLITGDEEEMYWKKIESDKEKKYSSKQRKRGRDKIVAKVDKLIQNKHIRFDD